ncbi:MAG: hypothetical protein ACT4TC_12425, partial [Myxococcaceae bacterium]
MAVNQAAANAEAAQLARQQAEAQRRAEAQRQAEAALQAEAARQAESARIAGLPPDKLSERGGRNPVAGIGGGVPAVAPGAPGGVQPVAAPTAAQAPGVPAAIPPQPAMTPGEPLPSYPAAGETVENTPGSSLWSHARARLTRDFAAAQAPDKPNNQVIAQYVDDIRQAPENAGRIRSNGWIDARTPTNGEKGNTYLPPTQNYVSAAVPPPPAGEQLAPGEMPGAVDGAGVAPPAPAPGTPTAGFNTEQATVAADTIFTATRGGATGLMTDKAKVVETLSHRSQGEIDAIAAQFKARHGEDLSAVLIDETSGDDTVQMKALLASNQTEADAAGLHRDLAGIRRDPLGALDRLQHASTADRTKVVNTYFDLYGGDEAKQMENASPQDRAARAREFFVKDALVEIVKPDDQAHMRALVDATGAQNPQQAAEIEAGGALAGIRGDTEGVNKLDKVFGRLNALSPDARKAALANLEMDGLLRGQLDDAEYARANAILQQNKAGEDAATIRQAMNATFGANATDVRKVLEGKSDTELEVIQSEYKTQTGKDLREDIRAWDNDEVAATEGMLTAREAQTPENRANLAADQIFLAIDGGGTNEDALKKALENKTPDELSSISVAYTRKYGEAKDARGLVAGTGAPTQQEIDSSRKFLREELLGDLGGRDQLELVEQSFDRGAPKTKQEKVDRIQKRLDLEQGFGQDASNFLQRTFRENSKTDEDLLKEDLAAAKSAPDDLTGAQRVGIAENSLGTVRASRDEVKDTATNGGAFVLTTAAVVVTAGAAAPAYAVIGAGAATGTAVRAGTNAVFAGSTADGGEVARQAGIGFAEGATAGVGMNVVRQVGGALRAPPITARNGLVRPGAVPESPSAAPVSPALPGDSAPALGGALPALPVASPGALAPAGAAPAGVAVAPGG